MKSLKTIKSVLAASVLIAVSGVANATYVTAQNQNSSVILTAFDTVLKVGYVRDLGVKYDTFYTNLSSGNALAGMNVAGDTAFTSIFSGSNINDIKWNVTAAIDSNTGDGDILDRLVTSAPDKSLPSAINAAQAGATGFLTDYLGALNSDCAGAIVCTSTMNDTTNPAYKWFDTWNGGFNTFKNAAFLNDTAVTSTNKILDLFVMTKTLGATNFFGNQSYEPGLLVSVESFDANLQLAADGSLTAVSAVPLPAAIWMFGAGLMGFVGIGRRRKEQA